MVTIAVVVVAFLYMMTCQLTNVGAEAQSQEAFWLAEAGIQQAVYLLITQPSTYRTNPSWTISSTPLGIYNGTYAATVTRVGNKITITSTGSIPVSGTATFITRKITSIRHDSILFSGAAFTGSTTGYGVTMSNSSHIDSYDSIDANGNPIAYNSSTAGSNGDVGGNSDISMSNSAKIKGDASTGPSGSFSDPTHKYVSGTVTHNPNIVSLPTVTVPTTLTGLTSGGPINLSNSATQTIDSSITGSNYKFSTINLSNSAALTIKAITAPVNIYLTGNSSSINISNSAQISIPSANKYPVTFYTDGGTTISNGSILNSSQTPANLILYSTSSNGISISNSGDFYGAIYAPLASVNMSNSSTIYGSIISNSLTMSNSATIHYDQSLINSINVSPSTTVGTFPEEDWYCC